MNKFYFTLSLLLFNLFFTSGSIAQENLFPGEMCKHDEKRDLLLQNEEYTFHLNEAEIKVRDFLQNGDLEKSQPPIYTIPVVFHVIHKGEAPGSGTNISDAQIQSAISALNRDFSASAADGQIAQSNHPNAAGDTEIQFCLASIDPNGNPTSGINRVNGSSIPGYTAEGITDDNEEQVKALSRWDNRYYMNVWVVTEIDGNNGDVSNPNNFPGGVLGYAYLPVSPVTFNSQLDGIVVVNLCLGNDPTGSEGFRVAPFTKLNRTLTHEVGHYLNLQHTFNGESCTESNCNTEGDFICDTPPTILNSDCSFPACSGNQQVENYLDYTGETCYEMFTNGQKDRMRATLATVRNDLVNTDNCSTGSVYDIAVSIQNPEISECNQEEVSIEVTLTNLGTETITSLSVSWEWNNVSQGIINLEGSLPGGMFALFDLPAITPEPGENNISVNLIPGSLNGNIEDQNPQNDSGSVSFSGDEGTEVNFILDLDNFGSETSWQLTSNGNIIAQGGPYTDGNPGIAENFCLPSACYSFTIFDEFGDGICCSYGNGFYELVNLETGEILVEGDSFGFSEESIFCIGDEEIPPIALFSANQTEATMGEVIQFTDASIGNPTEWNWSVSPGVENEDWEFVNSTTSSSQNPSISFLTTGLYTISLEASNLIGSDEEVKEDYISISSYCHAYSQFCEERITNVTLEGISNNSACENYGDFTNISTTLYPGEPYTIAITTDNGSGGTGFIDDQVAAWIDWNQDEIFDEESEEILIITYDEETEVPVSSSFTVPEDAILGETTMRVRLSYLPDDGEITPCGISFWGEVEDYSITIANSSSTQITITNLPEDLEISCDADDSPLITGELAALSNCNNNGGNVIITFEDEILPGSCNGNYQIIRSWTVTDGCDNLSGFIQTINVVDNEAPEIFCSIDSILIPYPETLIPEFSTSYSATDNCSSSPVFTQNPAAGTAFNSGSMVDVVITATDNCGNQSFCTIVAVIEDETSGISSLKQEDINIWPNPSTGLIHIDTPENSENISVEIFDVSGKLILNRNFKETNTNTINIENLAMGMYAVKISTPGGHTVKRIIKK